MFIILHFINYTHPSEYEPQNSMWFWFSFTLNVMMLLYDRKQPNIVKQLSSN